MEAKEKPLSFLFRRKKRKEMASPVSVFFGLFRFDPSLRFHILLCEKKKIRGKGRERNLLDLLPLLPVFGNRKFTNLSC